MNQLTAKIGLVAIIIALWAESVELSFLVACIRDLPIKKTRFTLFYKLAVN